MLLAVKSNLGWVAAGLAVILLATVKGKYLMLAAVIGIILVAAVSFAGNSEYLIWIIGGGLGLVLLLLARKETEEPQGYYQPPAM